MGKRLTGEDAGALVRAAAHGDRSAWEELVDAYSGLVWSVARSYRLDQRDAADVVQTTWLRLVEHVSRLQDPARVASWLATTARRESLRTVRVAGRQRLASDLAVPMEALPADAPDVDAGLLERERREEVQRAVGGLPPRSQRLLGLLMQDPPPSYARISALTGMPIGSIGPTRARLLRKVERLLTD